MLGVGLVFVMLVYAANRPTLNDRRVDPLHVRATEDPLLNNIRRLEALR